MTAPRARLRALRLSGFKSFAERTVLEFGPGISAVIGPNGSGKSNLADALRWALGEQGRSLRTRRSEDVIFAGSAKRHATGMADVSLVVDNADRLLPVDYGEIDFGRRLFRSGENEYLLNRQRIRLRDLVELLDSANLADNAFLFIGQGMVDQALSLRPEERRPLFEEVAGVRRHERRRRRAEEQLLEAEANLARVRDILGELRPQARRLAAQAEQQAARSSAADDFAAAIVASAWWRFRETAAGAASAHEGLEGARGAADEALTELRAAEEAAASLAERLASRAADERRLRTELDELLVRSTELRLAEGRAAADLEARRRDLARLTAERAGAEERLAEARRTLALPAPEPAPVADSALAEVERELAMAEAELEAVRRSGEREASLRRMAVARAAEVDRLRRRAADTERELGAAQARLETARAVLEEARRESDTARARLAASETHERAAEAALESARGALQAAEARLAARMTQLGSLRARAEAAETRAASLAAGLEADASDAMTAAAVRLGGRRLTDGLDVDPAFAPAVEAALDDAIRAAVLPAADLDGLGEAAQAGGSLVLAEAPDAHHAGSTSATREVGRALDAVLGAGGGRLADVVRRDPSGAMATLLRAVLWVPDMAAALAVRSALPAGWRVVTPAGDMVSAEGVVRLRRGDSILARRAEYERLAAAAAALRDDAGRAALQEAEARTAAEYARAAADEARVALDAARSARRATEDSERAAARRGEAAGREAAWEEAQVERLGAALERERQALAAAENESAPDSQPGAGDATGSGPAGAGSAPHRAWQDRLDQLRARRDALASEARAEASRRQQAAEARRRAEVALAMEERHLAELDEQAGRLMAAEATLASQTERLAGEVAGARELEEQARAAVEALGSEDAADREQLAGHERAASAARERLRLAEERSRSAEVAEMEARLQLEAVREHLLVELAALGPAGLRALQTAAGLDPGAPTADGARDGSYEASGDGLHGAGSQAHDPGGAASREEALAADLERALATATDRWRTAAPAMEAPPPGRLAALRRRYHELGSANPFATEEYAEVRARLEALEGQQADLLEAIESTRRLIAELSELVSERFRTTFSALEAAFGRRFEQLFGGGDAQLSLTDPEDLSQTGVEIMARPPGKKRQPLAMLSGGERALTAVALLFAMLEVRPVPFCVLDEVDAALDEANIGRFVSALRSLAGDIQFIVITHNRGTIEAADALYGVTIGDDAVSRIISLRLADPAAQAAEAIAVEGVSA